MVLYVFIHQLNGQCDYVFVVTDRLHDYSLVYNQGYNDVVSLYMVYMDVMDRGYIDNYMGISLYFL